MEGAAPSAPAAPAAVGAGLRSPDGSRGGGGTHTRGAGASGLLCPGLFLPPRAAGPQPPASDPLPSPPAGERGGNRAAAVI